MDLDTPVFGAQQVEQYSEWPSLLPYSEAEDFLGEQGHFPGLLPYSPARSATSVAASDTSLRLLTYYFKPVDSPAAQVANSPQVNSAHVANSPPPPVLNSSSFRAESFFGANYTSLSKSRIRF